MSAIDRRERNRASNTGMLFLTLLLMVLVAWLLVRDYLPSPTAPTPRTVTARGDLAGDERSTIELFRAASPSVVHITRLRVRRDYFNLNLYQIPEGTGSGMIWDDAGHIVTNFHVILNADAAQVTLADHSNWRAKLVGVAPDKDLAVLKIQAPKNRLRPIPIGSSRELEVGQKALAIGNPFGLDQTLTTGVISALGREIQSVTERTIRDVIQTDAAINPGNSGGPLLDSAGRLIGVNTAIFSPSGAYAGIGFAIPVDTVNSVVTQLIAHGKVIRPGLGVNPAPDAISKRLELPGVLILGVPDESAAARAGIRPTIPDPAGGYQLGDVILAIEGKPTTSLDELLLELEQYQVGDEVKVTLNRQGTTLDVTVTLEALD